MCNLNLGDSKKFKILQGNGVELPQNPFLQKDSYDISGLRFLYIEIDGVSRSTA